MRLLKRELKYSGSNSGSYYVRARKSGWSLYHQTFKNNKKTDTLVNPLAFIELGFIFTWNLEEARKRSSILNKEKTLHQAKARNAASVLDRIVTVDSLLFPEETIRLFLERTERENEGTEYHLKKVFSHFLKVQRLCKDLEMLPHQYKENEKLIYKWFASQKVSLDYTQKLIALLNKWGTFVSRKDGRFFEPIAPVRGLSRQRIRESHEDKKGVRTESEVISPDMLELKKTKLSQENYNFLYITVWFGLRPFELKSIKNIDVRRNTEGLEFLVVYQSKLVTLEKSKRYKAIPILLKEQKKGLEIITSGKLKAPIYKKMREVFGEGYGLYAGRKGFADLMLNKGYAIEDISLWLGHSSIETTWSHYKNKNVLSLPSPKKK